METVSVGLRRGSVTSSLSAERPASPPQAHKPKGVKRQLLPLWNRRSHLARRVPNGDTSDPVLGVQPNMLKVSTKIRFNTLVSFSRAA